MTYTLTVDQVARANEYHGGMPCTATTLGLICHGNHTVELLGPDGLASGWCAIRRCPKSGLCSKADLLEALGY